MKYKYIYNIHILYVYYIKIKKNNNYLKKIKKLRQYCYLTKNKKSILKNFLLSRFIIRLIINKYLFSGFKKNN